MHLVDWGLLLDRSVFLTIGVIVGAAWGRIAKIEHQIHDKDKDSTV